MISREKLANLCQWFKRKSFVICCGIAPVILLSALLLTCNFGYNVIVNGEIVGTAPSKKYVYNLIDSINEELAPYLGGSDAITVDPSMTPKIVVGERFSTNQELGEALKSYCPYLEKAYSVKSNGKTVVAFTTDKERRKCYDTFISNMTKGTSDYEIPDTVTFEYELVPYGLIKSGRSAVVMLERTYMFSDTITLNAECSLSDVLTAYAITADEFKKLNPAFVPGETTSAKIKSEIPYIRVLAKQNYTENKILRHSVKYETDDTMLEGRSEIKTEGQNGIETTDKVRYVLNGETIYEEAVKTSRTDAVAQVLMIGTREAKNLRGTGDIAKPYKNGVLTSRYGSRNGRMHRGVDIGGSEGSPITAADSGKVVFAGWDDSGYGNMVKIDHGNGYMTLYAHCKEVYVSEGDPVEKGDVISALGNTGRSTGPHLHFEIINTKDGSTVDPLDFFDI